MLLKGQEHCSSTYTFLQGSNLFPHLSSYIYIYIYILSFNQLVPMQCTINFNIICLFNLYYFYVNMKFDYCENYQQLFVRTRFVTNHNSVGFARKNAQTISFVERGFERLGLSYQTVGFSWCSYVIESFSPQESFSWRRAGRLWFLAIFPAPFLNCLLFLLYSPAFLILRPRVGSAFQD